MRPVPLDAPATARIPAGRLLLTALVVLCAALVVFDTILVGGAPLIGLAPAWLARAGAPDGLLHDARHLLGLPS